MALESLSRHADMVSHKARQDLITSLDMTTRPVEGVERFRVGYQKAVDALQAFGIDTKGAPSWAQISAGITTEKLKLAEKMNNPTLVLIPPITRSQMRRCINNYKLQYGIPHASHTYHDVPDDDHDIEPTNFYTWTTIIVEGAEDVAVNEALQMKDGRFIQNHEQVKALLADFEQKGLGVLSGARDYLAAVIVLLANGQQLDVRSWTVLNAKRIHKNTLALLGFGCFDDDHAPLKRDCSPHASIKHLRLRGMIRII